MNIEQNIQDGTQFGVAVPVALGSRCTLVSFCQVPFSVQFSVGKAGSVVNLHTWTIHQLYVTLLFSTFREKLPRSKENFRLESDSGKRAMAVHPTPPLLQLGASTTIENCCCASCNFILVKRLFDGCRYTFTASLWLSCSHSCGQHIIVTLSR